MSDKEVKHKPPRPTSADHATAVVRAGISAVPYLGGAGVELFNALIGPPLERRRDQWREDVGNALSDLEARVDAFDLETLKDNEIFVSVVAHASAVALRNHQSEKREFLCNAILNVALERAPGRHYRDPPVRSSCSFSSSCRDRTA